MLWVSAETVISTTAAAVEQGCDLSRDGKDEKHGLTRALLCQNVTLVFISCQK